MPSELHDYLRAELKAMHRLYDGVTKDLTDDQVNKVPDGGHQNLAFSLWHFVRTEDNCIQFVIQRKPTVWMEGGWPEKFGLDSKSQGTGFTDDEARKFRINGVGDFRTYMAEVFQRTEDFVAQPHRRRSRPQSHREAARRDVDPHRHQRPLHDPRLPPPRRNRVRERPRSPQRRRHDLEPSLGPVILSEAKNLRRPRAQPHPDRSRTITLHYRLRTTNHTLPTMILLLDGNNLAWAGYYGLERAMKPDSPERKHRVALLGLASMLLGAIARAGEPPTGNVAPSTDRTGVALRRQTRERNRPKLTRVAIAFDEGRPLRRRELFPAYQTGREGDPKFIENEPTILAAIDEFCAMCKSMLPFDVLRGTNTEADDLIAGVVHHNPKADKRIVSTDRDFLQLLGPKTTVYSPVKKVVIDESNFEQEAMPKTSSGAIASFPRERFLDYRALIGDPSDNLPGVPGIGSLTAAKLLAAHPLDDYFKPAAAPSVKRPGGLVREVSGRKSAAVEKAFAEGTALEVVNRNRTLMDLRLPAPCWDNLPGHTTTGTYDPKALEAWLEEQKLTTVDRTQLTARIESMRP